MSDPVTAIRPAVLETTAAFGLDEETTILLVGATSAALGLVVAWTAYRGYARNESRPMLFLAIGVAFLTVVPFVLSHAVDRVLAGTDATALLAVTGCYLIGLLAIVRSFRRPDSG